MAMMHCPEDGGHEVPVRFNPTPGERYCPTHGCQMFTPQKPRKGLGRGGKRGESPAEARARQHFNRVVTSRRCYFMDRTEAGEPRRPGHRCVYPLDAHHLIPKEWMRRELDLPEDELIAVMYDPIIGAPLCRAAHEAVERRADFIYWDELEPDAIEFAERHGMLGRLELESPQREAVAHG